MKPFFAFLFFSLLAGAAFSQTEGFYRIRYTPGFRFKPGLYLSCQDFKQNTPSIPQESIKLRMDEVPESDQIRYDSLGRVATLATDSIWGYSDGHRVFARNRRLAQSMDNTLRNAYAGMGWLTNEKWSELDVIGNICLLVLAKTVRHSITMIAADALGYPTPSGTGPYSSKTKEKQFMLDLSSGQVSIFNMHNLMVVVQRDPKFYERCRPPSRRKEDQMYYYLMQYNLKHPLYFPE